MNAEPLLLEGVWNLAMGESRPSDYPDQIQLPGSLQMQGFGDSVTVDTPWTGQIVDRSWYTDERYAPYRVPGNVKIPFWLQPEKHFVGVAWMERTFDVPSEWAGRRIELFLERVHITSTVWIDGQPYGSHNSLGAPHVYDLGCALLPGQHVLTIAVDNRLHVNVGTNAHSVSDHTQTNWNGIIGRIELRSTSPVWLEEIQVFPDIHARKSQLRIHIANACHRPGGGIIHMGEEKYPVTWTTHGADLTIDHPLPSDAPLWDEFNPTLHSLTLRLVGDDADDERSVSFGLREVGIDGTQITVNDRPIFLRGTLECAVFPHTGYPPTDTAEWRRIFSILQDYGFNHVRFHSWCPPEAAFIVADEMGFYLQVECGSWANATTGLGLGEPIDAWLYEEARALIKAYGNHPSFLLMAYGNEPRGRMDEYLTDWLKHWKVEEPRRLHTGGAGWPVLKENQFDNIPQPRLHRWGEGLASRLNACPPSTTFDYRMDVLHSSRPIVSHEIGQWCVYPDLLEIEKYQGATRARNFEIFRDSLDAHHMLDQAHDFLMASGKLQVLCYREEIETSLRTQGFGGYQLLQANDFPGQGTALVGWLNPFWEEKGYTSSASFRRFQSPTVLLARLEHRLFSNEDRLRADLEIAHYGAAPITDARVEWALQDEQGKTHRSGHLPAQNIPVGRLSRIGGIECSLENLPSPAKYRLVVKLADHDVENDWEIWVYPLAHTWIDSGDMLVTHDLEAVFKQAALGGRILYLPRKQEGDVSFGFTPIFWNTSWTRAQAPHTLGICCDPGHALFHAFPTEFHTNWQWWELIDGAKAMILDSLPSSLRPIVQVIDDWFLNQRLGLVFEARLGKAKLLVCGADLGRLMNTRHAARQFRKSLIEYMQSDGFVPSVEVSRTELEKVFHTSSPYAKVVPR